MNIGSRPCLVILSRPSVSGQSGHKASGDLKILGYSLTCTSASALQDYFSLAERKGECSFHTRTHIQSPGKDTDCLLSFFPLLYAENRSLKGQNGSPRGQSTEIISLVFNMLQRHRSPGRDLSYFPVFRSEQTYTETNKQKNH